MYKCFWSLNVIITLLIRADETRMRVYWLLLVSRIELQVTGETWVADATPSVDSIKHVPLKKALMFQFDSSPAAASRSGGRAGPWRRGRPFARKRSPAACITACGWWWPAWWMHVHWHNIASSPLYWRTF